MSSFLAQLVLTGLAVAVPATALLFMSTPRRPSRRPAVRVPVLAVLVGGYATGLGLLVGAESGRSIGVGLTIALSLVLCRGAARPWTSTGLVAWMGTILTGAAYLAYVAHWIATTPLSWLAVVASACLWLLEAFVYVLALGYVWELVDVLARWDWHRRADVRRELAEAAGKDGPRPFVSLHVPTHNEPPDLVIATLERLLVLEYDAYEVLVLDNNTADPDLWRPVEEFCLAHDRLRFFHLEDWPGYKSGALNFGLDQVDPRTELIGVIDADYQVEPDFLLRCTPLFAEPGTAFVQTPQDYRDWDTDPYFRRLYHSYAYFFDVSQRSRNERGGAIFGGTMGLIRREALEQVGRWDEWCITEDAELSLRLLKAGWTGTHVEESFGRGIMPLTFEALKRQRFRWCFGGIQILRMHGRALLPGRRTDHNQLTWSQRWAYLVGGLQWFGDLAGLLFTGFLLLGATNLLLGDGLVVRRFSGPLLVGVVGLIVIGMVRSLALLHRSHGVSWRDAIGALGLWLALGWAVAVGSFRGAVAREGVFLRTPKTKGDVGWRDALRGNRVECLIGLLCALGAAAALASLAGGGGLGAAVVALLLVLQGTGHLAAPVNSLAAIRADLTPELRRRRREALLSWTRVTPGVRRWGIAPGLTVAAAVGLLVVLATPVGGPVLEDLPEVAVEESDEPRERPRRDRAEEPGEESARPEPAVTPDSVTPATADVSPTAPPSSQPTSEPTSQPSATTQPTPTAQPSPTSQPSPTAQPGPTSQPSPTAQPTPTSQPSPSASAPTPDRPSGPPDGTGRP